MRIITFGKIQHGADWQAEATILNYCLKTSPELRNIFKSINTSLSRFTIGQSVVERRSKE